MVWLKGLLVASPVAMWWWASNRVVANISLLLVWRRIRRSPDRFRRYVVWMLIVNVVSLAAFFGLLPLLRR